MQELRLVLIIVGVLAISALLLHGLWSSRKDKPAKFGEKPIGRLAEGKEKDNEGFDQDGIGSVRVVAGSPVPEGAAKRAERREPELHFGDELEIDPLFSAAADPVDQERKPASSSSATEVESHLVTPTEPPRKTVQETVQETVQGSVQESTQALVQESVPTRDPAPENVWQSVPETIHDHAQAQDSEPSFTVSGEVSDSGSDSAPEHTSSAAEQGEVLSQQSEADIAVAQKVQAEEPPPEPDFLVLNVHARGGEMLTGVKLFQCLERHHLIYGENSVYHRHVDLAGTEPVLFTVANMVSPGYFPQDQLDEFATPGIAFYLMLPCHGRADDNFNLMLQTVQRIADEMGADILDHERNLITPQRLKGYREKAKKYL
ncbi:cell division protein ZipA [Photobacterium sp. 2_MG-2023]|uniref:cell division protein ZipA n=1 Tax=Photobacterium sp. 2_MG-2023 TaxID=3062663 RepID=UPI0026E2D58D|nr:cell division protein ZipA [Photobacterium sp. 2_MG-2023]MDO6581706.1 cell division protein ZipA [Photobacterium sp. 2_MG-2023]